VLLINTRLMFYKTDALYSSHLHKINAIIESIETHRYNKLKII